MSLCGNRQAGVDNAVGPGMGCVTILLHIVNPRMCNSCLPDADLHAEGSNIAATYVANASLYLDSWQGR